MFYLSQENIIQSNDTLPFGIPEMPESKYNMTHSMKQKEHRQSLIYQIYSVKQNAIELLYQISGDGLKYLLILLMLPIFLKEFTIQELRGLKNVASYIFPFLYCHFLIKDNEIVAVLHAISSLVLCNLIFS